MLWLVILFPLLGAIVNGLILRGYSKNLSHLIAVLAVSLSFFFAIILFFNHITSSHQSEVFLAFPWIKVGSLDIPIEFTIDPLSTLMICIITGIGLLIHIYSGGYMHEEDNPYRFYSYLNLFVFMMLLLVLGNNMVVMFIGWEGVGLCSYLLIGYWFHKKANAIAGMKAFIVNRIGDIGFLIGIFLTYKYFGTLSFDKLREAVSHGQILSSVTQEAFFAITLCLFIGACGKSAQIPLYVWLPDAMAGPTPVSALIHAATMVTAGIYMMTRLNFFFYLAPATMMIIAIIGSLTAFFAATIAIVQDDIKKVLAYSTVSQLGYMVTACGVGAFDAGVFHLLTHACFKALLFMGAGSIIVAMHHKQSMAEMGGLKEYMPITYKVFFVGVLAIIGIPGFSGFFSKDEILWKSFIFPTIGPVLWLLGSVTAALTSFYMVRLLCLTFYGKNRSDLHTQETLHETSAMMWGPLLILAFLSTFIGYIGMPYIIADFLGAHNWFADFLNPVLFIADTAQQPWMHLTQDYSHSVEWTLMGVSVALGLCSAGLALKLYSKGPSSAAGRFKTNYAQLHKLLDHKYYIDEIYHKYLIHPILEISNFLWRIFDAKVLSHLLVNGIGRFILSISGVSSFYMSGNLQRHALTILLAVVGFLFIFVF